VTTSLARGDDLSLVLVDLPQDVPESGLHVLGDVASLLDDGGAVLAVKVAEDLLLGRGARQEVGRRELGQDVELLRREGAAATSRP
jgi:hypothetical protein